MHMTLAVDPESSSGLCACWPLPVIQRSSHRPQLRALGLHYVWRQITNLLSHIQLATMLTLAQLAGYSKLYCHNKGSATQGAPIALAATLRSDVALCGKRIRDPLLCRSSCQARGRSSTEQHAGARAPRPWQPSTSIEAQIEACSNSANLV